MKKEHEVSLSARLFRLLKTGSAGCAALSFIFLLHFLGSGCCPRKPKSPGKPPICSAKYPTRQPIRSRVLPKDLKLFNLGGATHPPAGVQLLLRTRAAGEPYDRLRLEDLVIMEDGAALPRQQTALIHQELGTEGTTLFLVDRSGALSDAGQIPRLQRWLWRVLRSVSRRQKIGLASFDGRAELDIHSDFTRDLTALTEAVGKLGKARPMDRSRNLYGAMDKAISLLLSQVPRLKRRFAIRTLVLITTGPDVANRLEHDLLYRKMEIQSNEGMLMFAIGLGPRIDKVTIEEMGQTEHLTFKSYHRFDDASAAAFARRLVKHWASHRVLSVCSNRRGGTHALSVSLRSSKSQAVSYTYDARGFASGCVADFHRFDCSYVQCGGPSGSSCQGCPRGKLCHDHLCIDARKVIRERRRRIYWERLAEQAFQKKLREHWSWLSSCWKQREENKKSWKAYHLGQRIYKKSDCGFRIMAELGFRGYPKPRGAAGALLLGWSFPKLVEVHAGIGFSLLHAMLLLQARFKVFSYSFLDLMVVPRLGFSLNKSRRIYEADALLGLRFRIRRYIGLYAMFGPGVAHTALTTKSVDRTGFILPIWMGVETLF